jgi:hypothetical protein
VVQVQRREIAAAVEELDRKIKQWDKGQVNELSPEIVNAIRALGELTQVEDVEPTAYELVLCIDDFVVATDQWWRELDLNRQIDNAPTKVGGSDRMWTLWGQVLRAAPERPRDLPHPALLLKDQKVRDDIICHKYRFIDDRGRPDTTRLYEHLMAERRGEPSPHYDPTTFVALKDEQYAAKWAARWEGRAANLAKLGIMLQGRRKPTPPKRDHDIGELAHKSGMSIEVLARKMGITKREAEQQLADRGIVLDGQGTRFFDPSVADQARRTKDSDDREKLQNTHTYPELGEDVEERIRAMAEDRCKPNTIARALTLEMTRLGKPSVTYQRVQKVLKDSKATAA